MGIWPNRWRSYDPTWLVSLARARHPDNPALAEALAACIRASIESEYYVRFVSAVRANRPGSKWQFDRNVLLEDSPEGDLILDVLKDGSIGGVEFLSKRLASGPLRSIRGRRLLRCSISNE